MQLVSLKRPVTLSFERTSGQRVDAVHVKALGTRDAGAMSYDKRTCHFIIDAVEVGDLGLVTVQSFPLEVAVDNLDAMQQVPVRSL